MRPKPKLEVVAPLPSNAIAMTLEAFHEDRIRQDLARLAIAPGLFEQYIERARVRFRKAGERAILERWIEFYQTGERLIAARSAMERARSDYLQLAREHEVKDMERAAAAAKLRADIEEDKFRRDKAAYQRKHLERFMEGAATGRLDELEHKLNEAQERRRLDCRWDLSESLRASNTLIELQHWRRQQRDRILADRSLSTQEQSEDLQLVDGLYEQKRSELKTDTRIFED